MAAKLLIDHQSGTDLQSKDLLSRRLPEGDLRPASRPAGGSPPKPMNRESQVRSVAVLLFLLTVAAVVFAGFNFNSEWKVQIPDDGVWWVEHNGRLMADRVESGRPGAKSGIKPGDELVSINGQEIRNMSGLEQQFYRTGVWSKAAYSLLRQSVPLDSSVILEPAERPLYNLLRLIALIYLGIGLYVLLRRWTAPGSTHFYIFCLVSFIAYSFKYTGKLNDFDWIIYWGNIVAGVLQPALFLHFVLTFPEKREFVRKRPWLLALVYVPATLLLAAHAGALRWLQASERLKWNLDRMEMSYGSLFFLAAALLLWYSYRRASTTILRQQLKWVTRGTVLAIVPYTLFYVVPYLMGWPNLRVSALSLALLPLTFGYAIFRYRLMDVDLIFKRGVVYTLAAAIVVGLYFGLVASVALLVHNWQPSSGPVGLILAVVVTALLFDPVRKWIQGRVDQFFYRTLYDYRRTLLEFGRELGSETNLNTLLSSLIDRLSRTLAVDRMAIFLAGEEAGQFVLTKSFGLSAPGNVDLSFLSVPRPEPAGHLFFENTHQVPRETKSAQQAIARLDLNYYIPCHAQQKTIAVLGLGKTTQGDFLSSEDMELLETLGGYLGIAIQNGQLYASLQQKAAEYERLKDFNENIVESINVGVMALDMEDRIESWNAQMEVMYAVPRWQTLTQPLKSIFPAEFVEEFNRMRQDAGIRNLYKFRLTTPAGEVRTVNVAIAPLVTRKFQVIGRLVIMDDITERVELEAQLSQADKLSSIGLLAAGVAHEVNTPLAVISSYTQMLAKQLHGDPQKSGLLEKITRQTFRASEIVNNLLNFSRTSGSEIGDVDVNKVIADTLALLEHQFKVAKVEVQNALAPKLPPIQGNPGRLQQVFLNLFLNAKDAMPGGGTLRVATLNGESVSVCVSDTGSGIAPEHIQRIYDPFFTTKTAPREGQPRGTGLGLSVTYGIIQEHAGKIRVESHPGSGTTFTLDFPLSRKAVPSKAEYV
ncbi:MAG TPA: ATP-binding protein [Candidatus Acidoferrum sp.]|jgi:two-component system NtrC family sensor kinase|nr:ATP-binding protein [Candidatus Acidoferrum sp.]